MLAADQLRWTEIRPLGTPISRSAASSEPRGFNPALAWQDLREYARRNTTCLLTICYRLAGRMPTPAAVGNALRAKRVGRAEDWPWGPGIIPREGYRM
jgi:hypothetical protein